MADIINMDPNETTEEEMEIAVMRAEMEDLRLEYQMLQGRYDGMQDMARMNAAAAILPSLIHKGNAPKIAVEKSIELADLLIEHYEERIEVKIRAQMQMMTEREQRNTPTVSPDQGDPN